MTPKRITIIPHIHGKITREGTMRSNDIRVVRGVMTLPQGVKTDLISATIIAADDIEGYDPTQDEDLNGYFLSEQQSDDIP